ncbi:MAG: hydantoinase B/oxoprolinase family protein, partial [Deltaproteobacteria bacterium]|nr:hydantoinase B/oxoprolinase family protein [Deltaproteobacteria bacterium]
QADIGNSIPSTYHPWAKDVYEEGALIFPCIRVQRDYKDVDEIIRMAKMRIRVPEVWYGDYSAMVGAARIGERELVGLTDKYGKETLKTFCRQYHDYGRQRMIEQIRTLPAGQAEYEMTYDPIPGALPNGVTVRVKVTVDPDEGLIICDYTENDDSQPCGMNLCEATLTAAARTGVLNRLGIKAAEFPSCEGALSRIVVKMREGSIIGKAKHPYSSSLATNNVNDRACSVVQCALNQITDHLSMAEPHLDMGVSLAVISGRDSRYDNRPYVTQLISGTSGGPGMKGHDGYLFYMVSTGGLHNNNSVEMIERNYPILYLKQELMTDQLGSGRWDGGPAVQTIFAATDDPVTFVYVGDGHDNPAKGAAGGADGVPAQAYLARVKDGNQVERLEEMPTVHEVTIQPGQAIDSIYSSSGGYGDPLERDPELVRHRARADWISPDKARSAYGVVLDVEPELYAVDVQATQSLRAEMKSRTKGGE